MANGEELFRYLTMSDVHSFYRAVLLAQKSDPAGSFVADGCPAVAQLPPAAFR